MMPGHSRHPRTGTRHARHRFLLHPLHASPALSHPSVAHHSAVTGHGLASPRRRDTGADGYTVEANELLLGVAKQLQGLVQRRQDACLLATRMELVTCLRAHVV